MWLVRGSFLHQLRAWLTNLAVPFINAIAPRQRVHCPLCGYGGFCFEAYATMHYYVPNARCPHCGSLPRYRALATLLTNRGIIGSGVTCLDVAPGKDFGTFLQEIGVRYFSIDLGILSAMCQMDVQSLAFGDSAFDLIICFHVLEMVPNWKKALDEFRRSLRKNCFLVLSENYYWGQDTTIDFSASKVFSGDPLRRFGDDLKTTLESMGFRVETYDYLERNDASGDYFFICRK